MHNRTINKKVALDRLKKWEAITNLCLQIRALRYLNKNKKNSYQKLFGTILMLLAKEKLEK